MTDSAPPPWTRRERWALLALALGAFGLRVAHVLAMRESPYFDAPTMDGAYHLEWARAILAGERFQEGPFFRAPLYPWFLAATLGVSGGSLVAARVLQSLCGVATVVLTTALGRRLGGRLSGWVAGVLAATSWVLVYFDGEFLIPALAVPLNLAALLLTLRLADRATPRRAFGAGVAWGVAALARPNVLLLMPFLALWLAWRAREAGARRCAGAAALALGTVVPILPITVTNRVTGGEWVLISTQAGVNFWIGNNPDSDGSTAIVPGTRAGWWEGYYDSIAQAEAAEGEPLSASGVSRHYAGRAWRWMLAEPSEALAHFARKARLFVLDAELGNNLDVTFFAHHYDPLARLSPVDFDLLLALGSLGLLLGFRRAGALFPAWGFVLVYSASVVLFFVCSRFRVPVAPLLMAYAGLAIQWGVERGRGRDWIRLAAAFAWVAVVYAGANFRPAYLVPPEATGRFLLGQAALAGGRPAEAVIEFERALEARPGHTLAALNLGGALKATGDLPRAERVLREALHRLEAAAARTGVRPPGEPELRAELVDVLTDAQRPAEGIALSDPWVAAEPNQSALRFVRGRAFAALGQIPRALEELELTVRLDPRFLPAYDALEVIYSGLRRQADLERIRALRSRLTR